MPRVRLSQDELLEGVRVGVLRHVMNLGINKPPTYNLPIGYDWQMHIEGALGERAVSKYLGIPWDGALGNYNANDVGRYEVRTTTSRNNRLILHDRDKDDRPYVLVVGANGEYDIKGWIYGAEGKDAQYWSDPLGGRPAYFVPTEHLKPIQTLPKEEK